MHSNPIAAALEAITQGSPLVFENLTMIPLLAKPTSTDSTSTPSTLNTSCTSSTESAAADAGAEYVVLDEALGSGAVEITEVSEAGSVPDLRVVNRGDRPVLIIDGEELLGAKQNRVVNLSILIAAHSELTIPVSCVEAGRWRSRSRSFKSAPRTQYATGRAKRMANVSFSMLACGERMSDQAEVWEDIAAKSLRMDALSSTSAMEAIFDRHVTSIDAYVEGCRPVDEQLGALFAIDDKLIGFDLFDRRSTLRKMLPKLVRSVAVDAIDAAQANAPHHNVSDCEPIVRALAQQFVAVTAGASQHVTKALGLGDDARLTAPRLAGAALVVGEHVVHLSSFGL